MLIVVVVNSTRIKNYSGKTCVLSDKLTFCSHCFYSLKRLTDRYKNTAGNTDGCVTIYRSLFVIVVSVAIDNVQKCWDENMNNWNCQLNCQDYFRQI